MSSEFFKMCPKCNHVWKTREVFLEDESIKLIGYQVHFLELKAGMFLFNHSCQGTFAIEVDFFDDMYEGEIFEERLTGTETCTRKCLHKDDLSPCPAQ